MNALVPGHSGPMAPISDAVVVDVLRRVDRLTRPLVRRLGRPPVLPQEERDAWWADRVSRVAAGVSAVPRFAGKLADLLPCRTPSAPRSSPSSSSEWRPSTTSRNRPRGSRCSRRCCCVAT
ncbi:hypothetical protein [Blastococcus brunescens]|uniref:ER-bound oxygenase mpaB/mpaB'/Rubber oxygenase catalytic domain-containing protein n=1 Tax=Blastococcus brunescens TaxID=1564165 RepID=A0ABZ1B8N6_9ACTN|nr:hypothetical protein [Blastococcus sp. BMG 8361]WRL66046.1 hypothetical protein U6N30_11175 [Blastococcus sp. BMG 8361]